MPGMEKLFEGSQQKSKPEVYLLRLLLLLPPVLHREPRAAQRGGVVRAAEVGARPGMWQATERYAATPCACSGAIAEHQQEAP